MSAMIVIVAGGIMLLSAGAHAGIGWPQLRDALAASGVDAATLGATGAGWLWGSVAMTVFGVVTIRAGVRMRRGDRSSTATVGTIAAGYLLFGLAALVLRGSPHFLGFVATGLLAGLPVVPGWGGDRP